MSPSLSRHYEEDLEIPEMVLRGYSNRDLVSKEEVIGVFKEVMDLYEELFHGIGAGHDYAATALLLYACKEGKISWQFLRVIIREKINYVAPLGHFITDDLVLLVDAREDYDIDYEEYAYNLVSAYPSAIVEYLKAFKANIMLEYPDIIKTLEPADINLLNLRADYWKKYLNASYKKKTEENRVSLAYKKHLEKDLSFLRECKQITSEFKLPDFQYSNGEEEYYTSLFTDHNPPDKRRMPKVIQRLQRLCNKWCLSYIDYNALGDKNDRIFIIPLKILVEPDAAGTGLNVFIPKYYKFSHLTNYSDTEFAPLKTGMEKMYDNFTMTRSRPMTEKELVKAAVAIRKDIKKCGGTKRLGWDKAYKYLKEEDNWSKERIIKHLGERPKS